MVSAKTSVCCSSGRTLPDPEPVILFGRKFVVRPTVCGACCIKAEMQPKKQSDAWERLCPELHQRTDIVRLEDELRQRGYDTRWPQDVLGWQYGSEGLVLNGPTGIGKSRLMWTLLRRLLDQEHRAAVFLNAVRFRTGLQAAARDGTTEEFVHRLVRGDVRIGIIDFSGPPRGRLASFYRNKGLFEREAKSLSPNHGTEVT
jgi:hypothetical protein